MKKDNKIHPSFTPKMSLFKLNINSNNQNGDQNSTNFIKKFRQSLSRRLSVKKKKKNTVRKKSNTFLSNLLNVKLFSGKNNKIQTNQIQNLDNESKTIKITDNTKTKDYQINFPQDIADTELLNKNKKEKNVDALPHIFANENLIREKINYEKLCDITNMDNKLNIDSDVTQKTKMMIHNKGSPEKVNKYILDKIKKRNHFEKLQNKYYKYKNNFLSMRQSMSNDKRIQCESLIDKIRINKMFESEYVDEGESDRTGIETMKQNALFEHKLKRKSDKTNNSIMYALVNPKDNSHFSRYYLPRNGSMLLSKDKAKKIFNKYLS